MFKGWYEDESCEYEADFTQPVEYETNFYARWERLNGTGSSSDGGVIAAYVLGGVMLVAGIGALVAGVVMIKKSKNK